VTVKITQFTSVVRCDSKWLMSDVDTIIYCIISQGRLNLGRMTHVTVNVGGS